MILPAFAAPRRVGPIREHPRDMEPQGFTVPKKEWWHFDYQDRREYGIENIPFEKIKR